jgi:ABC-type uncharacterized transport system substrate-binding protein
VKRFGAGLGVLLFTGAAHAKTYIVASDQPAFAEAARAAREAVGGESEILRADDTAKGAIAEAKVVVAVGPLAARIVSAAGGSGQVVSCLTPKSGAAALMVPLQPATSDVFGLVRVLLPSVKRVAVFPSSNRSPAEITAAARESGLEVLFPRSDEPFDSAADRLVKDADAHWVDDIQAIPNGGAPLLVKKASDRRKQVIGPNRATVLQGAFFAVVPDPAAHGRAAGEVAVRLAQGESVGTVPAPPGRLVLNGALARTNGTKLPPHVARRAETVE